MKTTRLCILLAGLFVPAIVMSQSYAFLVLQSKGQTEVKSGEQWTPIKVGSQLKVSDEIKISDNGYLGLSHASGRAFQVKEPGSHKVADLAAKVGKGSSALNKYTDFILSSEEEKRNKLAATGAVHRNVKKDIMLSLPSDAAKAELLGNRFFIAWTNDGSSSYKVIVMDFGETVLATYEVSENNYAVDLSKGYENIPYLLVKVTSSNGNSSDQYTVKRLSGHRKKKMSESVGELGVSDEGNGLDKFILASFFEEKFMLIDALTAYQEAAALEPDVYQDEYKKFLDRFGFKVN
ncbi:MAG: hypothetical protein KF725_14580 [Cyclobacteriaceae bacterium]|nr:hypothetical protein [Cyclobacteriaceae bacterium]UYN87417.1 MAG: hypothetical protein KIT51_03875 [Cyclobacteriaceae bacterium]